MIRIVFLVANIICLLACTSKPELTLYDQIMVPNPVYDSTLAANLGPDRFGMKRYVLAFTRKVPCPEMDSLTAAGIEKEHQENVMRLASDGLLLTGGIFLDGTTDINRIWIINVATVPEAQKLLKDDPAIRAGLLTAEMHAWYGSAALQLVLPLGKRLKGGGQQLQHHHHHK